MIELWLFAHDEECVCRARQVGIETFLVDWEHRDKTDRQAGADTEINRDTVDDLLRLKQLGGRRRICRIDRIGPWTEEEIALAVEAGATAILVPMVEEPQQIDYARTRVPSGLEVGVLIETVAAVENAGRIFQACPDFCYVGLNDLSISRARPLFEPLIDGTIERLRSGAGSIPFGFAGLTVVDGGAPIPCQLLLAEMARVECQFAFARRSFRRDIVGRDWRHELEELAVEWRRLKDRSSKAVEEDLARLRRVVEELGESS